MIVTSTSAKNRVESPIPTSSQASCSTSTITTSSTRTTPSTGASLGAEERVHTRRRASTEGASSLSTSRDRETLDRELNRLKLLVSSRTQGISQSLVVLLTRVQASPGSKPRWASEELSRIQLQMEKLEDLGEQRVGPGTSSQVKVGPGTSHRTMEGVAKPSTR